ncbi:MAG: GntR family transcriptional regulator [Gammaproteobacteria bacterium]|nr:GntR family transcriptional regulator [Gammaproteobacteria bacterium]
MNKIDANSPMPLYHQIAQLIRTRIECGELAPGDILEPLREAADEWQVNFHTVRHAYAELARDGLVEMRGPRGTRVVGATTRTRAAPIGKHESLEVFLANMVGQAHSMYGLSPEELTELISAQAWLAETARPRVHVLECSEHQCKDLCNQLEGFWDVEAIPLCLDAQVVLPAENLIATHFHYNEIRLRWPRRLADISFVSISPASQLRAEIIRRSNSGRSKLIVCERDQPTAEVIAADISALFPANEYPVGTRVIKEAGNPFGGSAEELLLMPPRVWGALSDEQKNNRGAVEVRYLFDTEELAETARKMGWAIST